MLIKTVHFHFLEPFHLLTDVEQQTPEVEGAEHAHHDSDEQHHGEPADLIGPDREQDDGGDEGGDIGVEDG